MPKRYCPFKHSPCQQRKIHVGIKEINRGVNSKTNMQEVYDKTLSFLFAGANRAQAQPAAPNPTQQHGAEGGLASNEPQLRSGIESLSLNTDSPSQMLPFAPSGCLQFGSQPSSKPSLQTSRTCPTCRQQLRSRCAAGKCDFCERPVCGGCLRVCSRCGRDFCQLCTVQTYTHQEDASACLGCLPRDGTG